MLTSETKKRCFWYCRKKKKKITKTKTKNLLYLQELNKYLNIDNELDNIRKTDIYFCNRSNTRSCTIQPLFVGSDITCWQLLWKWLPEINQYRFTTLLVSVMFAMGSLKKELLNLRKLWIFNLAMSQHGTILVMHMKVKKNIRLHWRHLKKCFYLILTTRLHGPGEILWRNLLEWRKVLLSDIERRNDCHSTTHTINMAYLKIHRFRLISWLCLKEFWL